MKNIARNLSALLLVFVVSAAALCPAFAASASLPELPKDQCVVDEANALNSEVTQVVTDLNAKLETNCKGAQIGVLTVQYTGNLSTEDYATEAFNTWGIGDATTNNGVLILLGLESPIYEDGDYYVTYGDGFRNTTLESQASALAQTMEGDFVNRDYSDAVITCANNVADTIASVYGVNLNNGSYDDGGYTEPDDGSTTFGDVVLGIVTILFTIILLIIIVSVIVYTFSGPLGSLFWCFGGPRYRGPRPPRGRRNPPPPPPPPPPGGPYGGFGGPGPYGGRGPRSSPPPRRTPPRSTPPRSGGFGGGSFGGGSFGGGSFGGMGGGSSHGGGGGRGR